MPEDGHNSDDEVSRNYYIIVIVLNLPAINTQRFPISPQVIALASLGSGFYGLTRGLLEVSLSFLSFFSFFFFLSFFLIAPEVDSFPRSWITKFR